MTVGLANAHVDALDERPEAGRVAVAVVLDDGRTAGGAAAGRGQAHVAVDVAEGVRAVGRGDGPVPGRVGVAVVLDDGSVLGGAAAGRRQAERHRSPVVD